MYSASKPYNDLPNLPPTSDIESRDILKKCIESNKLLAELKGVCASIPNASILINAIPLQESRSSSEIENIITTNDDLYRAITLFPNRIDAGTKEVLRYREALWSGVSVVNESGLITTRLFEELCSIIKKTQMSIRSVPGTSIRNMSNDQTLYTPPVGEDVLRSKLANLERFIHANDDIDPLIKMAVIHYQFEAIHPFTDGNGRTGRIVNVLYLMQQGLLHQPILYLSRSIIERKSEYYERLRGVTERQEWTEWILFILECMNSTARFSISLVHDIEREISRFADRTKRMAPRAYSHELVDLLFELPYCKISLLEERGIAKRLTATKYLNELVDCGLLQTEKIGRDRLFINRGLMEILSS